MRVPPTIVIPVSYRLTGGVPESRNHGKPHFRQPANAGLAVSGDDRGGNPGSAGYGHPVGLVGRRDRYGDGPAVRYRDGSPSADRAGVTHRRQNSQLAYGQRRMQAERTRAILPDRSSFTLDKLARTTRPTTPTYRMASIRLGLYLCRRGAGYAAGFRCRVGHVGQSAERRSHHHRWAQQRAEQIRSCWG